MSYMLRSLPLFALLAVPISANAQAVNPPVTVAGIRGPNISATDLSNALAGTVAGKLAAGNDSRIINAAPLASPSFTGTPTVPTAPPGTNNTQAASTSFVGGAVAAEAAIARANEASNAAAASSAQATANAALPKASIPTAALLGGSSNALQAISLATSLLLTNGVLSLPMVNVSGSGTFGNLTVDPEGRITSIRDLTHSDVSDFTSAAAAAAPLQSIAGLTGSPTVAQLTTSLMGEDWSNFTVVPSGGNTARSLAAWLGDEQFGKAYGIKMDGITDDTTAWASLRQLAPPNSVIRIPSGNTIVSGFPSGSATNPVLWELDGTTFSFPGSSTKEPIGFIGNDLVENIIGGAPNYIRAGSNPDTPPIIGTSANYNEVGGSPGYVVSNTSNLCTLPSTGQPLNNYVWCSSSYLISSAIGLGQHVAVEGTSTRPSNALADGKGPRAEIWGANFNATDHTDQSSALSGAMVGIEDDLVSNGDDPGNQRIALQIAEGKADPNGPAQHVGTVIAVAASDSVSDVGRYMWLQQPFNVAGIDFSEATSENDAPDILMSNGQTIALTSDKAHTIGYSGGSFHYVVSGSPVASISDSGDLSGRSFATSGSGGIAYSATGSPTAAFSSQASSGPVGLRIASGQQISLEPTDVVHLGLYNSKISFMWGSNPLQTIDSSGNMSARGSLSAKSIQVSVVTVAMLPACNSNNEGMIMGVTDASGPTWGAPLVGGGSNHVPAYCSGSQWIAD